MNTVFYSRKSLQCIALVTMLLDHIGCILIPQEQMLECYTLLRLLGRMSFPLFCFLLSEGIQHTHNVSRYLLRVGVFALLSEIPFDLAFFGRLVDRRGQNVLFTLWLGLVVLAVLQNVEKMQVSYPIYKGIIGLAVLTAGGLMAEICRTDYGCQGIFLIAAFYLGRKNRLVQCLLAAVVILCMGSGEWIAVLSLYFVAGYQPERREQLPKWCLYIFYPLHLLILHGLAGCLGLL